MAKPNTKLSVMDRLKKAEFKDKKEEEMVVVERKEYEIVAVEKEMIDLPQKDFDYEIIEDNQMREDLQNYEIRLHRTKNGYHTAIGEILAEANEKYSLQGYGVFGSWLEHLGFNRMSSNRLINRYKMIVTNCYNQNDKEYFESLPLSLTYEVSSPNAPKELIDAVLSKKITTRKEYIEMKKSLSDEKKNEESNKTFTINFENILGEMQSFNEKYANVAKNIEKIKTTENREKLEKVYFKIEKLNKEIEMLIKEIL